MIDIYNLIAVLYFTSTFYSIFIINNIFWIKFSIFGCAYFLYKWITDNRKCTISYLECKLRKVKKEDGILYNALDRIIDLNQTKYKYYIIAFGIIISLINLYKYGTYIQNTKLF